MSKRIGFLLAVLLLIGCRDDQSDREPSSPAVVSEMQPASVDHPAASAPMSSPPADPITEKPAVVDEVVPEAATPAELPWPLNGDPELVAEFDHHSECAATGGHHCHSVAWSSDGRLLASGGADGRIVVRDLVADSVVRDWQPYQDRVTVLEFSPDGRFLVSDSLQGNVLVWSVADWSASAELGGGPALVLPDGGVFNRRRNGDFELLRSPTETEPQILPLERSNVATLSASADGQRFVTSSWDTTVTVRGIGDGEWLCQTGINGRAGGLSSNGSLAAIGGSELHLYDVEASRELWRCAPRTYCTARFSRDDQLVLASAWGLPLTAWDLTGRRVHRYDRARPTADLAFSPEGRFVATASTDGFVRVVRLPAPDSIARRAQKSTRTAVDLLNQAKRTPDNTERLKLLDDANMLDATLPEASFERAVVLSSLDRLDEADRENRRAIDLLQRAKERNSDVSEHRQTLLAWSNLNNCDVLLRANRAEEATRFGDAAVEVAPGIPMAHFNRGRAHLQHRSYGPALESLETAIQMGMTNALALHGHALTDLNETVAAIRDYEAAWQLIGPDPSVLYVYGQLLRVRGRYEESVRVLQLYSQQVPDDPSVQIFLGDTWLMLGNREQSLQSYQAAIEKDPGGLRAHLHLGDFYHQTGETALAEASYAAAASCVSEDMEQDQHAARLWATLGQHDAFHKNYEQAIDACQRALELDDRHHWTMSTLAWLLATCPNDSLRDGQRAVALADRACELTLNRSWFTLCARAAALAEVGQFEKASAVQRTARELAPHIEKRSLREQLAAFESSQPYREGPEINYVADGRPISVKPDEAPVGEFAALKGTEAAATPLTPPEIAERYTDAVVLIKSEESTGTGVILSEDGYVLTCAHVLPWSAAMSIEYHPSGAAPNQNQTAPAEAIAIDFRNDLALLKFEPSAAVTTVRLGLHADVSSGEDVVAIGNPANGPVVLPKTVVTGIVSNPRQPVGELVTREWIQTSASISPGFSGGPLFNAQGDVIGILVSKADFAQAGFAIPIDVVARFLGQSDAN